MKKVIGTAAAVMLLLLAAACGRDEAAGRSQPRAAGQSAGVSDVLIAGMAEADRKASEGEAEDGERKAAEQELAAPVSSGQSFVSPGQEAGPAAPDAGQSAAVSTLPAADGGVDVDLTALSSTMVYSEVFNMMVSPDKYIGKTIKMRGQFAYYHDDVMDRDYYACLIQDATACCAQGMEFELAGNYRYPEDYPGEGEEMCVVGVFDSYEENGYAYATLRNASYAETPLASR